MLRGQEDCIVLAPPWSRTKVSPAGTQKTETQHSPFVTWTRWKRTVTRVQMAALLTFQLTSDKAWQQVPLEMSEV